MLALVRRFTDPLLDDHIPAALLLRGTGGVVVAALVARHFFNESRRKLP